MGEHDGYYLDEDYNRKPVRRMDRDELETLKLALKEHLQVKVYISYEQSIHAPTVTVTLFWDDTEIDSDSDI